MWDRTGADLNTSAYDLGSWQIFDADCYDGSHVHDGFCQKYHKCESGQGGQGSPPCLSTDESNALFNRVGAMFSRAFTYGKEAFGIQIAVGTEAPMTYPPPMRVEPACNGRTDPPFKCWNASLTEQFYEGIFQRIVKSKQPISYYWIYSQEGWKARGNAGIPLTDPEVQMVLEDMLAAERAHKAVKPPFKLATNGWTLGPGADKAYWDKVLPADWTLSTMGEGLGRADVLPEYGLVKRKAKWVIPWIEDDNGRHGPEWWVQRTLDYGRNSTRLGADGFIGIHWRTRAHVPEFQALATFPWLNNTVANTISAEDIYRHIAVHEFGLSGADAAIAAGLMGRCDHLWNQSGPVMGDYSMQPAYNTGCRPLDDGLDDCKFVTDEATYYGWVDSFAALGSKIVGLENLERFGYYNATYQWLKAQASFECERTAVNRRAVIQLAQQMVHTRCGMGELAAMHAQFLPPEDGVARPPLLQVWPCEYQMSKLEVHQLFNNKSGRILVPGSSGLQCLSPAQVANGSKLVQSGNCTGGASVFSAMNDRVVHFESRLCIGTAGNMTPGEPAVLTDCTSATAAWSITSVVNEPTYTSKANSKLCLDIGSAAPPPPPPPPRPGSSQYVGPDRVFVLSPRGHVRRGDRLSVTAMAFLQKPWLSAEPPPRLMVRPLDAGPARPWVAVPMLATTPGRHVFQAMVPSGVSHGRGDFEYYVALRNLTFPALGKDGAVTVVVV